MSKVAFQSRITLDSGFATDGEMKVWEVSTTFVDNDGVYTGYDIAVGDVLAIDTSMYEPGTFSFFGVTNIVTPDATMPVLEITYLSVNDNSWGAPDLSSLFGQPQVISRPSTNFGLLPVVSKDIQAVSDKYTEYVQNYNFTRILDTITPKNTVVKTNGDATDITQAQLVYINETVDTQAHAASAAVYAQSRVAGLAVMPSVASGGQVIIQFDDEFDAPTAVWDALTGDTGGLKAGKEYFLSSTILGGLSNAPDMNAASVTKIGKALSSTSIALNIEPPIML